MTAHRYECQRSAHTSSLIAEFGTLELVGCPGLSTLRFSVSPRRCDTVTSAVMMQYSRDLKGHLASLFLNENINLGKKYVFDIKRTSKEVYDHARRALYNAGVVDLVSRSNPSPPNSPLKSSESMNCSSCEGLSCQQTRVLQEKLRKLKEAMLCMLCCEGEINSAFCPCGHTVCCESCAVQLQVRGIRATVRPHSPWVPASWREGFPTWKASLYLVT